ncbi:hypothetical protein C8Q80DRAFT_1127651 [Daedaleopsis nitida]|nr:hypothetical protein C8Q80DRAFT_1127651 [Daedaleopsis nitida]
MRRSSGSPESGSARKRQRLSSPTYEEQFPITQADMETFDELEKQLSQIAPVVPSQSRSLPFEQPEDHGGDRLDTGVLGGDEGKDVVKTWSSSPVTNPSVTQERAAEDNFFSIGSSGASGFVSAAFVSSKPQHRSTTGFTSAALVPSAQPSRTSARAPTGFTSAAQLPDASSSRPEQGDEPAGNASSLTLSKYGGFGFASALPAPGGGETAYTDGPFSSPSEPHPPHDYDSWFDSDVSILPPDAFKFKTARTIVESSKSAGTSTSQGSGHSGFTSGLAPLKAASQFGAAGAPDALPPGLGFASAAQIGSGFASAAQIGFSSAASLNGGKSNWAAPSPAAIARAQQQMKQWDAEFTREERSLSSAHDDEENTPAAAAPFTAPVPQLPASQPFRTPIRPALRPVENSEASPAVLPDTPLASKNPIRYTNIGGGVQMPNKQFKSPLMSRPPRRVSGSAALPSTERRTDARTASGSKLPSAFGFGAASALPAAVPVTPVRPGPSNATTATTATAVTSPGKGRALGMTPRRIGGLSSAGVSKPKAKFSTPFKAGMRPGDQARTRLELERRKSDAQTQTPMRVPGAGTSSTKAKGKGKKEYKFFDLNPPPARKTLASSGLRPLSYTQEQLEDMGINVEELRQMSPSNAVYYKFHSAVPLIEIEAQPESLQLGTEEALARLKELGCTLAAQSWVTNHYGLILWKLAGMVCLEPEREQDPKTKRWCWPEVIRQLLYRYERELNGGSRPALRLICTEDAPASCPMVLCVSDIVWSSATVGEHGAPVASHPELEVTDGWYRLRAVVDKPLARAVRRGLVTVGTKIAVSGTKLSGDRKEACDILQAYENTRLELSGNSSHLAPWHAKLGFVKEPFVATLDSLTADGGTVPVVDLVVVKAYPVAYLEFVRSEDGSVTRMGPRNEKDELKEQDQWETKRQNEIAKIRTSLDKQVHELEKIAERLHTIAGTRFRSRHKPDDPLPDHIENLYSELVEDEPRPLPSQLSQRLSYMDAGWLHVHTQEQIRLAKERVNDDIERELQVLCLPPRSVRDFRVVVVKDARWERKEPTRTAQITLWDPLRMVFSEGGTPGDIREGQRFLVTNLQPNQPGAWMAPGPESVIYLVSKRNTRWTNIRLNKY